MARPKEFDPEVALAKAIEVFRRRGYASTSTTDLTEEMGIGRGSLFATFGTKDQIFRAALRGYQERSFGWVVAELEASGSPKAAIRHVFESIARSHLEPENQSGCLIVNTTVELGPHDPEVQEYLRRSWTRVEDALARAIARGQAAGEIDASKKPRALARFFVTMMRGMGVGAKLRPDRGWLADTIHVALDALG